MWDTILWVCLCLASYVAVYTFRQHYASRQGAMYPQHSRQRLSPQPERSSRLQHKGKASGGNSHGNSTGDTD
jgi:hypothetical protein